MLEEWVDGEVLDSVEITREQIERSGQMLAQLHACDSAREAADDAQTHHVGAWLSRLREHVRVLIDAGVLSDEEGEVVVSCAAAQAPDEVEVVCVHRDLCPENIVVEADGALRWIDAGTLSVGPMDEDLCRVWYRWPMAVAERDAFVRGYASVRDAAALRDPPLFWMIVVLAGAARYRVGPDSVVSDIAPIVEALGRLVRGDDVASVIDRSGEAL